MSEARKHDYSPESKAILDQEGMIICESLWRRGIPR